MIHPGPCQQPLLIKKAELQSGVLNREQPGLLLKFAHKLPCPALRTEHFSITDAPEAGGPDDSVSKSITEAADLQGILRDAVFPFFGTGINAGESRLLPAAVQKTADKKN